MKIEVDIDEALLARAEQAADLHDRSELLNESLRTLLLYRRTAQDLIALGGYDPNAWAPGENQADRG